MLWNNKRCMILSPLRGNRKNKSIFENDHEILKFNRTQENQCDLSIFWAGKSIGTCAN